MATTDSVTVINHCLVTPPLSAEAAADAAVSLPLTFLDMIWLYFSPIERVVFYEFPQLSKSQFVEDIIPRLKTSLSLTLKYFLPLAGNLIVPANADSGMPEIRYTNGNSVAVIFAECNSNIDFNHLIVNDERSCAEFHPLIPDLKSSLNHDHSGSEVLTTSVLALQVTLFPNFGLSIGISNHHTVGDASSIFNFMKTWAILHSKLSEGIHVDAELLVSGNLPIFDKTLIKDTKGFATIFRKLWDRIIKHQKSTVSTESTTKTNNVRKTFVISPKQVEKLKNLVLEKGEKVVHLSSFTVKVVGVAGSPRYNYYNLDFGWGKPIKFEIISIDKTGAISLSGGRSSDGHVEVGLSLSKDKMNAFSTIFMEVLNGL